MEKKASKPIIFTILLMSFFWWTFGGAILAIDAGEIGPGDFWVMNLDGSGLRRLTDNCHVVDPKWSPDNQKLLYISQNSPSSETYGKITWLEIDSPERPRSPLNGGRTSSIDAGWSPDGKQIAYIENDRMYFVDISNGKRLSSVPIEKERFVRTHLSWSPDGSEIVFFSDAGTVKPVNSFSSSIYQLYILNIDSSESRPLGSYSSSLFQSPTWSPDGNFLALPDFNQLGATIILAMDGSEEKYIWSQNEQYISKIFWSPDGNSIAAEQPNVIFTINPDGSNRQNLRRGFNELMGWDEEGTSLIYRSISSGNFWIYKIGAQDSTPEKLTKIPMRGEGPILSPNRERVVFRVPYCGTKSNVSSIERTIRWRQRGEFVLTHILGLSSLNEVNNNRALGFFLIFPFLQSFVTVGLIGWQIFSSKPTRILFKVILWLSIIFTVLLWSLIFFLQYALQDLGSAFIG